MLIDSLKLEQLRRHFEKEKDAIEQAIINELNRDYNTHYNAHGTRRFLHVLDLIKIDNGYYRVKVVYIDYFVSGPVKDIGVYYIYEEVL